MDDPLGIFSGKHDEMLQEHSGSCPECKLGTVSTSTGKVFTETASVIVYIDCKCSICRRPHTIEVHRTKPTNDKETT